MLKDIEKHRFIMLQILKDIYSDLSLENALGFKGGTAAYFLYNLPRFSVDLDFDLIKVPLPQEIIEKIEKIISKYGKVLEKQNKHFTLFYLLSYQRDSRNIKIEISKRIFPNHYEIKHLMGIPIKVLSREDIFAHKLVALLERKTIAHRDLFDIYFFSREEWPINSALVELRVKIRFKDYVKECVEKIKKIDERYVLQGLGELLEERQKIWVKAKLKKEVLFFLKARFFI